MIQSCDRSALPYQREHHVDRRRLDADQLAEFLDDADERIDLHGPAALEVLEHRRLVRAHSAGTVDTSLDIDPEVDVQLIGDGFRFEHHGLGDGAGAEQHVDAALAVHDGLAHAGHALEEAIAKDAGTSKWVAYYAKKSIRDLATMYEDRASYNAQKLKTQKEANPNASSMEMEQQIENDKAQKQRIMDIYNSIP